LIKQFITKFKLYNIINISKIYDDPDGTYDKPDEQEEENEEDVAEAAGDEPAAAAAQQQT
jgi:hypothetical protein